MDQFREKFPEHEKFSSEDLLQIAREVARAHAPLSDRFFDPGYRATEQEVEEMKQRLEFCKKLIFIVSDGPEKEDLEEIIEQIEKRLQ